MGETEKSPQIINPDLLHVFGRSARIQASEDGNIVVHSMLEDGMCPGGQHLQAELLPKTNLGTYDTESMTIEKYKGYPVKRLIINGFPLEGLSPIIVLPPSKLERRVTKSIHSLSDNLQKDIHTSWITRLVGEAHVVSHEPRFIRLSLLRSADDIAVLYHEQGHENSKSSSDYFNSEFLLNNLRKYRWFKLYTRLAKYIGSEIYETPQARSIGDYIFTNVLPILQNEREASLNALYQQLQQKNSARKVFPRDPELHRVRKLYQMFLLTYRNWGDGIFNPFFSKKQKQRLDQQLAL